jgi:ribosomal protein S18 acetylase RimI-like enzyme
MLRELNREDVPNIVSIRNNLETRKFLEVQDEFTLEQCYDWFDSTKPWWFAIEEDNNFVGYIRTSNRTNESLWVGMDIDINHRRKGYALKYYKKFFIYLKETTKIKKIFLEVFTYNTPAKSLYDKLGFIEVSRRNIEDGRTSILMELSL